LYEVLSVPFSYQLACCPDTHIGHSYRRPGKKQGAKLHYTTLHAHLRKLTTLFKRFQNPIDGSIIREAHVWIDASLVERDLLATRAAKKQVAMPADLTMLRQALFQIEYLATFANCRAPLQFALFLVLIVDCSGRAGELVAPTKTDNKHLNWSQVSFYAFPTPAGVTTRANIAGEDLKDPKPHSS
jgi:hypothetical protein